MTIHLIDAAGDALIDSNGDFVVETDEGAFPAAWPAQVVLHAHGPYLPITRFNRAPDIAVAGDGIDYHWEAVRQGGDVPEVVQPERALLVLRNLRPGQYRYRFTARIIYGQTATQDYLVIAR